MNRTEATRLAEIATREQINKMLTTARAEIENWQAPSHLNKSMSRGAMFNIFLECDLEKRTTCARLSRINMLREFGEYFPNYQQPARIKRPDVAPFH